MSYITSQREKIKFVKRCSTMQENSEEIILHIACDPTNQIKNQNGAVLTHEVGNETVGMVFS